MRDIYDDLLDAQQPASPPAAGGDIYDRLLDGEAHAVGASLHAATMTQPDRAARVRTLAQSAGLPEPVVERNEDEVARRARLAELHRLAAQSPILRRQLTDVSFARLAQDDGESLTLVEKLMHPQMEQQIRQHGELKGWEGPAPALSTVARGLWASFTQGAERARQGVRAQFADTFGLGEMSQDALRRFQRADAREAYSTPEFESSTARGLYGGGASLARMVPGLAASIATRSSVPALASIGVQTQAEAYGKYRARGGTPGEAFIGASGEAAVEVGTELLPMGFLVNRMGKAGAGEFLAGFLARELPTEQVATVLQDALDTAIANPDKTWGEYLAERPDAAYQTFLGVLVQSGVLGGVNTAARRLAHQEQDAQRAEADAQALEALAQAAESSKLRERAPDLFEQFVAQASQGHRLQEVFIDADALTAALGQDLPAMRAAVPSLAEQLDDAQATGGAVQIPVSEFAAYLTGKPYTAALIDQIRTVPDGASRAESAALFQSDRDQMLGEAAVEEIVSQAPSAVREAEARSIEAEIAEQFNMAGRFSPEVNRAYAALPGAFFRTMADRLGVSARELYEQAPLTVARETLLTPDQRLDQGRRGAFIPDTNTLVLLKGADLSTALHEMGHYFLENYARMAGQHQPLAADMQTLLNWMGGPDLATWQQMSIEQRRAQHEKFARGFESYLFEGKAPSMALQGLFARFRAWLTRVYRSLQGLNVELSDEVRAVFDRMLATEQEIDNAQRARAARPIFASAEEAAAFGVDWADYQAQAGEASAEALASMEARSLKDMTWAGRLREETIKRLNQDAAAKRKEVRREVEAEVRQEPVYRAKRWLKRGEMTTPAGEEIKAEAGHRLSIPALRAMYPAGELAAVPWEKLGYGKWGMLAEDGMHPDQVAEIFGFSSGDAMVRELLDAPRFRDAVEALTDLRMLERFGDLTSPEAIARAADQAIHNDVRTRFLATELAGLQKAMGSAQALARMAKDTAAALIEKTPAGRLRPTKYAAAEVKAGKAAEQALRRGDVQEAIRQKRLQIINHAATRAAYEAQAEVDRALVRFRQIATAKADQVAKSRNADIANAARAILAEYGIGQRGERARQYMEKVREYDPQLFEVLEPMLQDAEASAKPITELPVADLRALRDTVESLWHLARREKQVEIDGQLIDREEITRQLSERLEALGVPERTAGEGRAPTEGDKRVRYMMGLRAALRRVEAWVSRMDGGKIDGAFRRYLWNPVSEAADAYRTDAAKYLAQYRDLLKSIEPTLTAGKIEAPELGYTFGYSKGDAGKAELLHALLHTGNESNKRKLLLGRGWATEIGPGVLDTGRWDAFVARMIREGRLTKADIDFVQGVWDLLESIKPLAQKTHRDVFGRYFDEVSAQEFSTPWGVYRGGYVPAIADTFSVQDAAIHAELDALNQSNSYMFPATNRGFTKSRVEYNRPLALDLRLLPQHIDKVLLFAHMEPKVRDVMRTLKAKGFGGLLTRYDPVAHSDLLLPWLNRAAKQTVETPATGWAGKLGDRFFRTMRSRSGMAAMFANLTNALQQVTGFSIAAVKVRPRYLKAALVRYVRAPSEVAEQVAALSPFMANRLQNQVMDVRQQIDHLLLNPSAYEKAQAWTAKHGYFLQQAFQNVVDVITWAGAYDQALAQGHGEQDAVRAANAAVRETQGSMSPEDISRYESGPAFVRLFTQFSSYFNMQANLVGTELATTAQELGLRNGAGRLFYIFLLGFLIPAWMSEAIVQGMRGGIDDEDDDGYLDEFMAFFFGAPARTAAAMVPVAGQGAMVLANSFNRKPYDDRMSTAPAVSMIESAASAPHSLYKAIADDGNWRRATRDTLTLITITTGLPVAALGKPIGYAADVAQDRVDPTGPVDAVRGALSGAASPESKQ